MKQLKLLLTTILCCCAVNFVFAQNLTVTGIVTDAGTGEPVAFAYVQVKGTTQGVQTNDIGYYSIAIPAKGVLIFSSIGYSNLEMPVNGRAKIDVSIQPSNEVLEDVLVVAYGTAKKESFTGSAEVVKSEKLTKRTVSDVTKAIDGLATGVVSTSGSGQPGSGAKIVIRGFGSINASQDPLYVVDGVPYGGNINAINPADIESMTILKDASAGALYGSRGANGVIMITTKKGSSGKISVNFKASFGIAQRAIPQYDLMDEKGWIETNFQSYRNDQIYNKGIAPDKAGAAAIKAMTSGPNRLFGSNERYNPYDYKLAELIDPSTGIIRDDAKLRYNEDWIDESTRKNPFRQDYILSLTGGNDKTKYMASLGYTNEDGLLQTTNFERFSGRINVDNQAAKWFKMGLNANFSTTTSNYLSATGSSTSNVWYSAMLMAPIYPVYEKNEKGENILDAEGNRKLDYGNDRASGSQQNYNCIATLYDDKFSQINDNFSGRAYIDLLNLKEGAIKGLKFSANFGIDYVNRSTSSYENPYFGNAAGSNGRAYKYNYRYFTYTFNQIASYSRTFAEKHNLDFMAGHEYYYDKTNYIGAGKSGFPFGGLYELASAATTLYADSKVDNYRIESYFTRLNYNYNDKYYLSGSYRRDGSSRFHVDNRWGNFWSVGATWRVSEESFMKDIKWINNLSLRGSYGSQGNDNISTSYYPWQALYDLGYPNAGQNGAIVASLENKELRWEKNDNLNIGIEAKLFNRLNITAEWYNRKTSDMLMYYPMANSLGFSGFDKNIGEMKNSGFEISLSGDIFQKDNFRWNMTLMGSTVKNEIIKLADKPQIINGNFINREGESINSFYLPESAGVDPATGKQLYWVWDEKKDDRGATVRGERYLSADKTKASTCRDIQGSRMPKFYGSINNQFTIYKNIDFGFLCTYSIGGKILDYTYNNIMDPMYEGNSLSTHLSRAWQKPGDITDVPMNMLGSDVTMSSRFLHDASYFAIKNMTLGYSLPKKWITKMNVSNVRIAATADNLFIFTKLKGMDPQYNFSGTTDFVYTPTITLSLSLDITF